MKKSLFYRAMVNECKRAAVVICMTNRDDPTLRFRIVTGLCGLVGFKPDEMFEKALGSAAKEGVEKFCKRFK